MSKTINVGRVTAYAEAVAGGYTGTLEEWEHDLANLGTTAAEVEANRQAVAEDKAAVEEDVTTAESYKNSAAQSASEALQSAESAHTDALAATAAKEAAQTAQGLAEEAKADAVSAKGAAENAQTEADQSARAAAGSALVAGNAATTATAQAGAASDSATAAAASAASVSGVVQEVTAAKTEAITAIETKGAETLDSIPDDYTELSGNVDDLKSAANDASEIDTLKKQIYAGELIDLSQYKIVKSLTGDTGNSSYFKIDTGLKLGPTLKTVLDMRITTLEQSTQIGREAVNGAAIRNTIGYATDHPDNFYFAFGNENLYAGVADTKRHTFYIDVPNLKYGYDTNTYDKSPFTYGSTYTNISTYLFGRHAGSTMSVHAELFGARYYDNGVLIAYFVPVVRISDEKPGVYDVIRQGFYTYSNNENINLVAGEETVDERINKLEDQVSGAQRLLIDKNEIYDNYSAHFNTSGETSSYIYFTDPHIYNASVEQSAISSLYNALKTAYNSTPIDFVMCGGDWLQGGAADVIPGGPTVDQACGQLGFAAGTAGHLYPPYYPVFGNHDSNYKNTALSHKALVNLMFRGQGESYYRFDSLDTTYFVFDSGLDSNVTTITAFRAEQLDWFAAALARETKPNIVISAHMFYSSNTGSWTGGQLVKMAEHLTDIAAAYNSRSVYTAGWDATKSYDYTASTGRVQYYISGHLHHDMLTQNHGIPAIITDKALVNHTTPTFDLVLADYDNNIVSMTRIGNGADRLIHLDQVLATSSVTLSPSITPAAWASSDTAVATVADGVVTAVSSGYAMITATDADGRAEAWVISI